MPDSLPDPYHSWQRGSVRVDGALFRFATKPGALSHGAPDVAAALLAELPSIPEGASVVVLNCGNGLPGAVAARRAGPRGRVLLSDRNALAAEAARRTMSELDESTVAPWRVLLEHGVGAAVDPGTVDVVLLRVPAERIPSLLLLLEAFRLLRVGGTCYLAGATNEGIKSAAKLLERIFGGARTLSSAGGHRAVVAAKQQAASPGEAELASPWQDAERFHELRVTLRGEPLTLYTRPGVFSWEHLDEATAILADAMVVKAGQAVLDLGCGSGALGVVASRLSGGGPVCIVDADAEAIRCATRTAVAAGVRDFDALASDVAFAVLDRRFDVVLSNPPFHVGRHTDLTVPRQFIRDAWSTLSPGGRLYLVANRTLPYESMIAERFGETRTLHDGQRFKVLSALRP